MPAISEIQTTAEEFVITERVVTNNFIVRNILEDVENRLVRVELEVGPFVETPMPVPPPTDGTTTDTVLRGTRRWVAVWSGDEYDAVRDTWGNTELLAAIPSKL
jgi:hypothetical protein